MEEGLEKSETEHPNLSFIIKALHVTSMWPQERKNSYTIFREYLLLGLISVTTLPVLSDFILQFQGTLKLTDLNENIIALLALFGVIYISICFKHEEQNIKKLVEDLAIFEEFCSPQVLREANASAQFYTKFFIIYGIVGNFCYSMMPFINYKECTKNKSEHMLKYGIPCGLVARFLFPFKFDYTPLFQIVMLEEVFICILVTCIIMMVTMLLSGILIHVTSQLKYLRMRILEISDVDDEKLRQHVNYCIKYHIAIIGYAKRTDSCFRLMMLLHITWTGVIMGVLGLEVILLPNFLDAIRFVMHLTGWILMLLIVCHYGQTLMDESTAIAVAVYNVRWYEKPVDIQKDLCLMLLRSQKALTIKAAGLKEMTLATFLGVLYSAYSYFTLLLKFKQ